jgi:hypothetical protein
MSFQDMTFEDEFENPVSASADGWAGSDGAIFRDDGEEATAWFYSPV